MPQTDRTFTLPRPQQQEQRGRLAQLTGLFKLPAHDLDLAAAQLAMLSGQAPVMYTILMGNAVALATTHYATAPKLLTLAIPLLLLLLCSWRLVLWLSWRHRQIVGVEALTRLRGIMLMTAMLGICFTIWALSLFRYGDAYAQCHVEFFLAFTVVCCNFCLMQLRPAALLLTCIVTIPFFVFFLHSGHMVLIAVAWNMALATAGMVSALLRNEKTFTAFVISERELVQRQMETQHLSDENLRLANLDALSSLPNRRRFFAELEQVLQRAQSAEKRFAVALLDLDRFKGVNDIHGHAAGDRLLTQIGLRLKRLTSERVFIARLGGDEFGIILSDCQADADIFDFGKDVQHLLEGPCVVGDRLANISCSIGVAVHPQAGNTAEELFERADYALYHSKQTNKGGIVVFSDEHETRIRQAARLEQAFRLADYETEMWVAFQPIVDVIASRVIAFEALARWDSRELGPVGPDQFVPIAERTQMIGDLTSVLLKKALIAARGWPADISVCFNLSAHNLASLETMAEVRRIVRNSHVPPARIEFEVTETALLEDFAQAAAAIDALHELGVRVALDDFGTGFSSLGYVHRLKLDKIKIDKSFVADVVNSHAAPAIIKTIVALCQNLQLDCVAEGVETEEQLRAVAELGCHRIQGYFFSRPVNQDAVTRLIEKIAALGCARAVADIASHEV